MRCAALLKSGVPPGSLVANGDFSQGVAHWGLTNQGYGTPTYAVTNGQLCVTMPTYGSVTLGWPSDPASAFALSAGSSYTFSYQASTTAKLPGFEAKIGQAVTPYTGVDFDTTFDVPTSSLQTFTHTFTPSVADAAAGVAFNLVNGTQAVSVCFDNVAVTKN